MDITSARITIGLNARAESSQPNTLGDIQIGWNAESIVPEVSKAYTLRVNAPMNEEFVLNPKTGDSGTTYPWPAASTYTKSQAAGIGNVAVGGFTDFQVGGFNMETSFEVSTGDTTTQWLDKLVSHMNSLIANPDPMYNYGIVGFRFRREGSNLIFEPDPESSTPGVITTAHTLGMWNSGDTAISLGSTEFSGGEPYGIFGGDGKDFDGATIGTIEPVAAIIKCLSPVEMYLDTGYNPISIPAGGQILFYKVNFSNTWTFIPEGGRMDITILGN